MLEKLKQKLLKLRGQGKSKSGTNRLLSFDMLYQLSYYAVCRGSNR